MMGKVAILHTRLDRGGRSRFVAALMTFLNQKGYVPDLYAFEVINEEALERAFAISPRFRWIPVRDWGHRRLIAYSNLALNLQARKAMDRYDLVVNCTNHLLGLPQKRSVVHYVNFPAHAWNDAYPSSGMATRAYWGPLRTVYRRMRLDPEVLILANSHYTADIIRQTTAIGRNQARMEVIFPPVNLGQYWDERPPAARQQAVVSLGRFSAAKGQRQQLAIARHLPDLPFHIIGQVAAGASHDYYERCIADRERYGVKNASLHANLPFADVLATLHSSRFFLHSKEGEPFGMSTVEAIAAGCIPVVPDSGGQREIVPMSDLRFRSNGEAVSILRRLMQEDEFLAARQKRLQEHVQVFGYDVCFAELEEHLPLIG